MKRNPYILTVLGMAALLAACEGTGGDYVPIVDGHPSAQFQSDLTACQQVAREKPLIDGETREDALIGAGIGALAGIADSAGSGLEGAVIGGAIGTAAGSLDRRKDRADIVVACMKGRGHAVVE